MDDLQRRIAELIWQREPELLEDLSRLKGLLADYLPHHPAHRRALLIAVECKVAASIQACTREKLPILRSQLLARLKTEGLRDEDAEWTVETLMFTLGPGFDSEACFQMGLRLAPERLLAKLETTDIDDYNLTRAGYCFKRSASRGHAEACLWLGEMFRLGKGLHRDPYEANLWYQRGAEHGSAGAQYRLGLAYEANLWYQRRAEHGSAGAQYRLGLAYESASGAEESIISAIEWLHKSAEQGHAGAQFKLGQIYSWPIYGRQDIPQGLTWMQQAAMQGLWMAAVELGELHQLQGNDSDAILWFSKAALSGGSLIAFSRLGDLLANAPVPNFPEAFRWYSAGAKRRDIVCMTRLAEMYEHGKGIGRDTNKALELWHLLTEEPVYAAEAEINILRIGAEAGDPTAQVNLGITYENGEHPQGRRSEDGNEARIPDFEQAVHWYRIAAEAGDADGQWNLGDMYEHGKGVKTDKEEAMKWYRAAALQDHPEAETRLQELCDFQDLEAEQAEEAEKEACDQRRYLEALHYTDGHSLKMEAGEVVEAYRAMAERGNLEAQVALADILFYGRIERWNAESIRWYKNSRPVEDQQEGIKWYRAAAAQGHLASQKELGELFFEGEAVSKDHEEALKWYLLAAKQGDADAQYFAGLLYELDDSLDGYAEFEREAGEWDWLEGERGAVLYWKAALQGHAEAAYRLAKLIEELGFNTAELYIEDQIRWYEVAARNGHVQAAFEAACHLETNRYGDEELDEKQMADNGRAFKWFLVAAEAGHERAQIFLSKMYEDGRGVAANPKEALRWALRAAEQGASDAQLRVSEIYSGGHGIKENRKEAAEWCIKAAEQGYPEAQLSIAKMYRRGVGVEQSYEKARDWYGKVAELHRRRAWEYLKSAEEGNKYHQRWIGKAYLSGKGVKPNRSLAVHWLRQAAQQGDYEARMNLRELGVAESADA